MSLSDTMRVRAALSSARQQEVVVLRNAVLATRAPFGGRNRPGPSLQGLLEDGLATAVFSRPPERETAARRPRMPDVFVVTAPEHQTKDLMAALKAEDSTAIVYIAPKRGLFNRNAGAAGTTAVAAMDAWGQQAVGYPAIPIDASTITVAVVDTGADIGHPDLIGAILDYHNHVTGEPDDDQRGHGTHVCGILAGRSSAPAGVRGVCNALLSVYKGLGTNYSATDYYRALGDACTSHRLINLSLGGTEYDPTEEALIRQALNAGGLVVAAMGNSGDDGTDPCYPAALGGVIAVGAIDKSSRRAKFSNAGDHIALVAPGVDIWSTVPRGNCLDFPQHVVYAPGEGTSMATPFVTGVIARLAALDAGNNAGTWDAQRVRGQIPVEFCPGQIVRNPELGCGMIRWGGPHVLTP